MQFAKRAANAGAPLRPVIVSQVMKLADLFARRPMNNANHDVNAGSSNRAGDSADSRALELARGDMVERQLRKRDIRSPRVLEAMDSVPRHLFVPPEHIGEAYADTPLPIGVGQTISQPFMVAAMADALLLEGSEKVLEIGAGSGYQAAVLSLLAREVIAIESQPSLAEAARARLAHLGYSNVRVETDDGSQGWLPDAPYDAILVTAAAPYVPPPLLEQLADRGRLVIPVGPAKQQELLRMIKREGCTTRESLFACRFVPLLGRFGWPSCGAPQESSRG
jgi:protein-L-isoaspartate(D-aspartate) O-methyltransferase